MDLSGSNQHGSPAFSAVILAGGSGTRFWPRSRRARAKQVLALDGERTMIQQTLDRLLPVTGPEHVWVITNDHLAETIAAQLPDVPRERILAEPAARNTAPACALAAFLLERSEPDTVLGIFPSDHVVKDPERFAAVLRAGIALAAAGENIIVLGVPPTRPETGYGYIEQGAAVDPESIPCGDIPVHTVRRFTEKPNRELAEQFVASGDYMWNGGIFLWSARTLANAVREYCPVMAPLLERIAAAHGTSDFDAVFAECYPQCENISIDYAVLEPRSQRGDGQSNIFSLPGDFLWNDLGSWAALHEHLADCAPEDLDQANVLDTDSSHRIERDATGNYVFAPGKMVAIVGVSDLVVVETDDALLITTRQRSQDVGKIVAELKEAGRHDLI